MATKSISKSQRVNHEKYGLGIITETDAKYTVIEFDQHGRKKFLTDVVALEPSEEPPPPRRRSSRRARKA